MKAFVVGFCIISVPIFLIVGMPFMTILSTFGALVAFKAISGDFEAK